MRRPPRSSLFPHTTLFRSIAVPRNIEPGVNDVDNVFLYDIDDLQEVVNANLRERMKEADHAEAMVTEEVARMMSRLRSEEHTSELQSRQYLVCSLLLEKKK